MLVVQQVLKVKKIQPLYTMVKCRYRLNFLLYVCRLNVVDTFLSQTNFFSHPQLLFNFEPVMLKRDFINKVLKLYAIFT